MYVRHVPTDTPRSGSASPFGAFGVRVIGGRPASMEINCLPASTATNAVFFYSRGQIAAVHKSNCPVAKHMRLLMASSRHHQMAFACASSFSGNGITTAAACSRSRSVAMALCWQQDPTNRRCMDQQQLQWHAVKRKAAVNGMMNCCPRPAAVSLPPSTSRTTIRVSAIGTDATTCASASSSSRLLCTAMLHPTASLCNFLLAVKQHLGIATNSSFGTRGKNSQNSFHHIPDMFKSPVPEDIVRRYLSPAAQLLHPESAVCSCITHLPADELLSAWLRWCHSQQLAYTTPCAGAAVAAVVGGSNGSTGSSNGNLADSHARSSASTASTAAKDSLAGTEGNAAPAAVSSGSMAAVDDVNGYDAAKPTMAGTYHTETAGHAANASAGCSVPCGLSLDCSCGIFNFAALQSAVNAVHQAGTGTSSSSLAPNSQISAQLVSSSSSGNGDSSSRSVSSSASSSNSHSSSWPNCYYVVGYGRHTGESVLLLGTPIIQGVHSRNSDNCSSSYYKHIAASVTDWHWLVCDPSGDYQHLQDDLEEAGLSYHYAGAGSFLQYQPGTSCCHVLLLMLGHHSQLINFATPTTLQLSYCALLAHQVDPDLAVSCFTQLFIEGRFNVGLMGIALCPVRQHQQHAADASLTITCAADAGVASKNAAVAGAALVDAVGHQGSNSSSSRLAGNADLHTGSTGEQQCMHNPNTGGDSSIGPAFHSMAGSSGTTANSSGSSTAAVILGNWAAMMAPHQAAGAGTEWQQPPQAQGTSPTAAPAGVQETVTATASAARHDAGCTATHLETVAAALPTAALAASSPATTTLSAATEALTAAGAPRTDIAKMITDHMQWWLVHAASKQAKDKMHLQPGSVQNAALLINPQQLQQLQWQQQQHRQQGGSSTSLQGDDLSGHIGAFRAGGSMKWVRPAAAAAAAAARQQSSGMQLLPKPQRRQLQQSQQLEQQQQPESQQQQHNRCKYQQMQQTPGSFTTPHEQHSPCVALTTNMQSQQSPVQGGRLPHPAHKPQVGKQHQWLQSLHELRRPDWLKAQQQWQQHKDRTQQMQQQQDPTQQLLWLRPQQQQSSEEQHWSLQQLRQDIQHQQQQGLKSMNQKLQQQWQQGPGSIQRIQHHPDNQQPLQHKQQRSQQQLEHEAGSFNSSEQHDQLQLGQQHQLQPHHQLEQLHCYNEPSSIDYHKHDPDDYIPSQRAVRVRQSGAQHSRQLRSETPLATSGSRRAAKHLQGVPTKHQQLQQVPQPQQPNCKDSEQHVQQQQCCLKQQQQQNEQQWFQQQQQRQHMQQQSQQQQQTDSYEADQGLSQQQLEELVSQQWQQQDAYDQQWTETFNGSAKTEQRRLEYLMNTQLQQSQQQQQPPTWYLTQQPDPSLHASQHQHYQPQPRSRQRRQLHPERQHGVPPQLWRQQQDERYVQHLDMTELADVLAHFDGYVAPDGHLFYTSCWDAATDSWYSSSAGVGLAFYGSHAQGAHWIGDLQAQQRRQQQQELQLATLSSVQSHATSAASAVPAAIANSHAAVTHKQQCARAIDSMEEAAEGESVAEAILTAMENAAVTHLPKVDEAADKLATGFASAVVMPLQHLVAAVARLVPPRTIATHTPALRAAAASPVCKLAAATVAAAAVAVVALVTPLPVLGVAAATAVVVQSSKHQKGFACTWKVISVQHNVHSAVATTAKGISAVLAAKVAAPGIKQEDNISEKAAMPAAAADRPAPCSEIVLKRQGYHFTLYICNHEHKLMLQFDPLLAHAAGGSGGYTQGAADLVERACIWQREPANAFVARALSRGQKSFLKQLDSYQVVLLPVGAAVQTNGLNTCGPHALFVALAYMANMCGIRTSCAVRSASTADGDGIGHSNSSNLQKQQQQDSIRLCAVQQGLRSCYFAIGGAISSSEYADRLVSMAYKVATTAAATAAAAVAGEAGAYEPVQVS